MKRKNSQKQNIPCSIVGCENKGKVNNWRASNNLPDLKYYFCDEHFRLKPDHKLG